ncbi:hypothetical protein AWP51_08920 [Escherichia coli]|nr:hypothetical protein AWP51_08920 [Escherichia coli]
METVLENIRQGLNRPSHRHERVRGCMSLFVAGVTIFAQYGPLAPLGRGGGGGGGEKSAHKR